MKASEVMTFEPRWVRPETAVKDVARMMLALEIDALPVVDADGRVAGIISERELLETQAGARPDVLADGVPATERSGPMAAAEIMARRVPWASEDTDVLDVARTMLETGRRHVVVLSNGRLLGIVSRWDLLKAIARPDGLIREEFVERLEDELQGTPPSLHVEKGEVVVADWCDNGTRRAILNTAHAVPGVIGVTFASRSACQVTTP
jgi:CBS domain-containing protein